MIWCSLICKEVAMFRPCGGVWSLSALYGPCWVCDHCLCGACVSLWPIVNTYITFCRYAVLIAVELAEYSWVKGSVLNGSLHVYLQWPQYAYDCKVHKTIGWPISFSFLISVGCSLAPALFILCTSQNDYIYDDFCSPLSVCCHCVKKNSLGSVLKLSFCGLIRHFVN